VYEVLSRELAFSAALFPNALPIESELKATVAVSCYTSTSALASVQLMCPGHANQHGQEQTGTAQCVAFTITPAKGSIRADKYITIFLHACT
jgi:hypothetical protein